MNMISNLVLLKFATCREFPVFGRIQGYLVRGIIDEIRREALEQPVQRDESPPDKKTRVRQAESPELNLDVPT